MEVEVGGGGGGGGGSREAERNTTKELFTNLETLDLPRLQLLFVQQPNILREKWKMEKGKKYNNNNDNDNDNNKEYCIVMISI